MVVLVCGSRGWTDEQAIWGRMRALIPAGDVGSSVTVLHGDARGADRIAGYGARVLGMNVEAFPANWEVHGKQAGFLRNIAMLERGPDLVLAFQLGETPGTKHTVEEAQKRSIPVELHLASGAMMTFERGTE